MATGDDDVWTRSFAAGRAAFTVRCPSPAIRDSVESLFADLPAGDEAVAVVIGFERAGEDELTIDVEGGQFFTARHSNAALTSLVTAVSRLALDSDPDRLHLHCAGLSLDGRGVLISAPSETGKTTLAAALALRGWTYVSDEAIAFERGSTLGAGFAKPLVIKPGGEHLVPELASRRVTLGSKDEIWWHVAASALPTSIDSGIDPGLIVLLQYASDGSTGAPPVVTPVHPADAVVGLMGQTMDAERFGDDAVVVLAEIAARCTCVSMTVGPLDRGAALLRELVVAPSTATTFRILPAGGESGTWSVAASVRSVVLGDRAVLHDGTGGAIAALDEAGTAIWLALHGETPEWLDPEALRSSGTEAFLEQLAGHGLVTRTGVEETTRA